MVSDFASIRRGGGAVVGYTYMYVYICIRIRIPTGI